MTVRINNRSVYTRAERRRRRREQKFKSNFIVKRISNRYIRLLYGADLNDKARTNNIFLPYPHVHKL